MKHNFTMWVLYDHPEDFPDHYIARRYNLTVPTENYITNVKLESLRIRLESEGYIRISRTIDDDPCVVECWI